jgi:predicted Zn-dependent protease
MGNTQKSEEAMEKSLKLATSNPELVSADVGMELAETCLKNGRKDEANELIRTVVKNHHEDKEVLGKITQVYQDAGVEAEGEELIKQTQKDIVSINNQGVELIKQGKLSESIEFFSKAVKGMPQNPIINLNAAQSLIMEMKDSKATKPKVARALSYIKVAQHSEKHQDWANQLMGECRELSASLPR